MGGTIFVPASLLVFYDSMTPKPNLDIAPKRKSATTPPIAQLDQTQATKFEEAMGTPAKKSPDLVNPGQAKKRFWKDWDKRRKIIFTVVVIAILVAAGLVYWFVFASPGKITLPEIIPPAAEEPLGPMTHSPLTGLEVPTATAEQTPMALVIENMSSIRPQSGLSRADVVYEFLAEGGITRFLAIFASTDVTEPNVIGPIRSLRAYMIPVSLELLAPVYHVGGAPNALELAKEWKMRDVNQFFDSKYFWRDSSVNGQGSPHNVWTRMPEVKYAVRDHGWPQDDGKTIVAWKFKDEAPIDQRGNVNQINVQFSSGSYNVEWTYDKTKNRYARSQAGVEHTDRNTKEQLTARNVVVQYCQIDAISGDDKGRIDVKNDEGEGAALVFNDGKVTEATWKKKDRNSRTIFYDKATGEEMKFIPGNFWIEVPPESKQTTWEEGTD